MRLFTPSDRTNSPITVLQSREKDVLSTSDVALQGMLQRIRRALGRKRLSGSAITSKQHTESKQIVMEDGIPYKFGSIGFGRIHG